LEQVVGQSIPETKVLAILKNLKLAPQKIKNSWKVTVPPHRLDLTCEEDIIEEVVRFFGFDVLKASLPNINLKKASEPVINALVERASDFLVSRGFYETIHFSFGDGPSFLKLGFKEEQFLKLSNPLSEDAAVLRPTLLAGLIHSFMQNHTRHFHNGIKIFECRSIFRKGTHEERHLAGLYGGPVFPTQWKIKDVPSDIYFGKGILENLFKQINIDFEWKEKAFLNHWHPSQALTVLAAGNQEIGGLGALHPQVATQFELPANIFYFDLNLSLLTQCVKPVDLSFKPLSPYPAVARDLSLVVEKGLSYEKIISSLKAENAPWLSKISLFDVYEGERLPEGKKGVTFSLTYESNEKTLTDEEVNRVHFKIVDSLCRQLGVLLRS
jgi:phenylalanyl-tRNA synthetase beta chain